MINRNLLLAKLVENGYNQSSFASKIGVSRSTFNRWLSNKSGMDVAQAEIACKLLGVTDGSEKAKIFLSESSH